MMVMSSWAARVFSVEVLDTAYSSSAELPLETVTGFVTMSPGAIFEKVTTALVGWAMSITGSVLMYH